MKNCLQTLKDNLKFEAMRLLETETKSNIHANFWKYIPLERSESNERHSSSQHNDVQRRVFDPYPYFASAVLIVETSSSLLTAPGNLSITLSFCDFLPTTRDKKPTPTPAATADAKLFTFPASLSLSSAVIAFAGGAAVMASVADPMIPAALVRI